MKHNNQLAIFDNLGKLGRRNDFFNSLIDDFFHFHGFSPFQGINNPDFSPALDIVDSKDKYTISVEIPGINKKDVHIEIEDNTLMIKGEKKSEKIDKNDDHYVHERCYGAFRREIQLPSNSNTDNISAKYNDGVLTLKIPKIKVSEKKTKAISIS